MQEKHSGLPLQALSVALALGLGTGCRHAELTQSGFLQDYAQLSRDLDQRARMSFVDESVDWSAYDSVIIEPLEIRLQATSNDPVSPRQESLLRGNFTKFLREGLEGRMRVVDAAGPSTLRVRGALTEIDCINVTLNVLTTVFIIWPVDFGGATLEVEVLDSESGKQLAAIVNADKASAWVFIQSFHRIGHACQALEETADWVADKVAMPAEE